MTSLSQTSSNGDTEIASLVEKNYYDIQLAINAAANSVNRDFREVALVAVSKTVGVPEIESAIAVGIHDFGENRTNLLKEKHEALPHERWHFIGRIQTNKLKDVVGRASLIHSVTSQHALEVINKLALAKELCQDILIEVNVSGEDSKDGVSAKEAPQLLEAASSFKGLRVKGLMTMAPIQQTKRDSTARETFSALRELQNDLMPVFAGTANISLNELSMGMSDDFEDAIKEGATIVRIGRRLWS